MRRVFNRIAEDDDFGLILHKRRRTPPFGVHRLYVIYLEKNDSYWIATFFLFTM